MSPTLMRLGELHELCSKINPDPVELYEILRAKEMRVLSEGHPEQNKFTNLDGQDGARVLTASLQSLATALTEVVEYFRNQLVAEHIANSPDKFLP